jgi:predicted transcriptional regulator
MSETTFTMQLDADLKKAFEATCKSQNRTPAHVARELMRVYVKKHSVAEILNKK